MVKLAAGHLDDKAREEVIEIFQKLLQFDTTNPPGNETPAANFLADVLRREGIAAQVVESAPGRGNLVASFGPSVKSPSLLFLSHIDVVPATKPESWKHPPFSGAVDDGWIYGRGAVDTKYLTAAQVMALILLKRRGVGLRGSLKLAAVADEERGGVYGAGWLVKNHPEYLLADFAINEGGGDVIRVKNKPVYLIESEEKGICWVRVRAHGVAAHGSLPMLGVSAVAKMSEAIQRIVGHPLRAKPSKTFRKMMEATLTLQYGKRGAHLASALARGRSRKIIDQMRKRDRVWAISVQATMGPTISATMINGGVKENVIPDYCEAVVDCRLPVGMTSDDMLRELRKATKGISGLDFEVIQHHPASGSPVDHVFYQTITDCIKRTVDGEVEVAPFLVPGATDSRYIRPFGVVAYGFAPTSPDVELKQLWPLVHGVDERINKESLWVSTNFLTELALRTLG